jgi:small subunit ribosomal protein S3
MGQKTNPIGFRLGVSKDWRSRYYAGRELPALLKEDELLRKYLKARLGHAAIADIIVERKPGKVVVTLHTGRPGVVIGKKGAEVDKLRDELGQLTGKEVGINVEEIKRPELESQLVADNVASQLAQRISFRRAMKRAVQSAMRMGAQGIKIKCAGRLGGAEIARVEGYHEGRVPLHTLRADIDYATSTAMTTFGTIGVKVWIYKGEKVEDRRAAEELDDAESEAGQVSQDVQGSHARHRVARRADFVRLVRSDGHGAGLDHEPADRGRSCGADASHQARRQGLDPDLPRQADHQEAGRDPHG